MLIDEFMFVFQTDEPGGYVCQCSSEYKGDNCEELKIKRCKDNPCLNGARCDPVDQDPNNPHDDLYR